MGAGGRLWSRAVMLTLMMITSASLEEGLRNCKSSSDCRLARRERLSFLCNCTLKQVLGHTAHH